MALCFIYSVAPILCFILLGFFVSCFFMSFDIFLLVNLSLLRLALIRTDKCLIAIWGRKEFKKEKVCASDEVQTQCRPTIRRVLYSNETIPKAPKQYPCVCQRLEIPVTKTMKIEKYLALSHIDY